MAIPRTGRPRLDAARKRTVLVSVRFSSEELKEVDRKAAVAGLRRAAYCRKVVLGARIRSLADHAARGELRRLGNNLNQLAYHANATGRLQQLGELRSVLEAVKAKVREL